MCAASGTNGSPSCGGQKAPDRSEGVSSLSLYLLAAGAGLWAGLRGPGRTWEAGENGLGSEVTGQRKLLRTLEQLQEGY